MGRAQRILVGGSPCGWGNLGEDAIVHPLVTRLKARLPEQNIGVMTCDFEWISKLWQVRPIGVEQRSYIRCFIWADKFIFSGSTMLSELHEHTTLLLSRSRLYRVPAMIHGAGMNELSPSADRDALVDACNYVRVITTRDRATAERLRRIGVTEPIILATADPAIACVASDEDQAFVDKLLESYHISLAQPTVGVGITFHPGYESHLPPLAVFAQALEYIASKDHNLLFVPSEVNFGHDTWMHMRILNLMKDKRGVHMMCEKLTPGQMVALHSRLKCFVGTRLHQIIICTAGGTPVLAMDRDEKVTNFLARLDQPSVSKPKDLQPGQLENAFDELVVHYDEQKTRVIAKRDEMRRFESVNEQVMDAFLGGKKRDYFAEQFADYCV